MNTGFNFSPLIAPWYAIANTLIGMVVFFWIITAAIHYSGLYYFKYLPISNSDSYDNTGAVYDVSCILKPDLTLDEASASPASSPCSYTQACSTERSSGLAAATSGTKTKTSTPG